MADPDRNPKIAVGAVVGAGAALFATWAGIAAWSRSTARRPHDDAPGRTRRRDFGDYRVVGRTVTINRPRHELYAYWRDFQNLPKFMENVEQVQMTGADGQAVWTISAPGGLSVEAETRIVEEADGALIAWRSVAGSQIDTEGRVAFREAPDGRGTWVEAIIAYKPPAGRAGAAVARLFRKEPEIQARHDLKRFKMLMETGEIATGRHFAEKD